MMRTVAAAVAVVVLWVLVLGTVAGIPWSAPLWPGARLDWPGSDFRPVIGAGVEDGTALGIGGTASDGNALQSVALDRVHAAAMPVLSYRFEDFPRTLELALVFRRADAPEDVQTVVLPWPESGSAAVDLRSASSAWRGEIIELGFAEYAAPQVVPPSIAFRPFRLLHARLESSSWGALPRLLRVAWFGYRPWNQASINVAGSADVQHASMPATIVVGGLLSFCVLALLLRWRRERLARGAVAIAVLGWCALDLRWLDDLADKHRLTEAIYAGKSWHDRARLQPDEDIAGFAQLARQQLTGTRPTQRILVASDSTYTLLRLIYFLLPLDAAPLDTALQAVPASAWPADTIIVVCSSRSWRYDDATSALRAGGYAIAVTPLFVGGNLAVYRLRRAEG